MYLFILYFIVVKQHTYLPVFVMETIINHRYIYITSGPHDDDEVGTRRQYTLRMMLSEYLFLSILNDIINI